MRARSSRARPHCPRPQPPLHSHGCVPALSLQYLLRCPALSHPYGCVFARVALAVQRGVSRPAVASPQGVSHPLSRKAAASPQGTSHPPLPHLRLPRAIASNMPHPNAPSCSRARGFWPQVCRFHTPHVPPFMFARSRFLAAKPSSGTDRPRSDGASALPKPPTWAFAGEERPLRAKGRVRRARARFRGQKSRVSPHGGRAASGAPGEEGGCAARESRWRRGGRPRRARGQRGPAADARGGAGARRARRATGTSVLCLVFRTSSREPQGGSAPISGTRFGL